METPQIKKEIKKVKQDVDKIPQLKEYSKKKLKNDIDKITKSCKVLEESISNHNDELKVKKDKLEDLTKQKEQLVILNNLF